MSRSLVVLPDDSAKPILDAINQAAKSLSHQDVSLYRSVLDSGGGGGTSARRCGSHHAQSQAP